MSTNLKVALQDFIHQYFHQNVTFQDTVKVTGTFTVTVDDGKDEDCHLHEVLHKDQHNCSCNLLMGQDRLRHIKQEVESEDEVTENSNCESNAAGQSLVDTKPFSQAGQASLEDSKKLYSDSMPTSTLWLVKNTETGETITAEETAESNLSVMRMGSLLCDESKEIKPSTSDQAEIDENNSIPTSDELSAEKSNENTDVAVECIQMSQLDKDASFRKRCLEKIQKDTNNFMKAGSCKRRKSADVSNMPGEQFLTTEWTQESSPGQSSLAEGQLSERLEEAANETHSISSSSATSQFVSDPQCAEIFKELKQQMFCLRAEVMSRVDKVEERLSNVENSKPLESATNSHTTSSSLGTETVQNVTTTVDEPNLSNSRKGRMASCRKNSKRNEGTAKVAPVSPSDAKQSDRNGTKHSLASEVSATSEREGVRKICPLQQMKFWHRKSSGFANFGVKAARYLFSPDEISKANCSAVQGKQEIKMEQVEEEEEEDDDEEEEDEAFVSCGAEQYESSLLIPFEMSALAKCPEKVKSRICLQCGKTVMADNIWRHLRTHGLSLSANEIHSLGTNVYFRDLDALELQQAAKDTAQIICDQCGKMFQRKSALKEHLRDIHEKSNYKFVCDVCNKRFTRPQHLQDHMNIHYMRKPYMCHCNRTFYNKISLLRHKRKCSGQCVLTCSHCKRTFSHSSEMVNHVCIRQPVELKCHGCGQQFSWKTGLNRHKKNCIFCN